jgi:uncharacterized protein (TIGR00725 family)
MSLQITVIGDSHADPEKYSFCEQLGKLLAKMNIIIITGGGSGVMEAVCKGAFQSGGHTVGILPGPDKMKANKYCRVVIPTGLGHGRNSLTVMAADLIIAVGGQTGTLTEMGFGWLYNKPIIAVKGFGGWSEKMSGKSFDSRREGNIKGVNTFQELKQEIEKQLNIEGKGKD